MKKILIVLISMFMVVGCQNSSTSTSNTTPSTKTEWMEKLAKEKENSTLCVGKAGTDSSNNEYYFFYDNINDSKEKQYILITVTMQFSNNIELQNFMNENDVSTLAEGESRIYNGYEIDGNNLEVFSVVYMENALAFYNSIADSSYCA